MKTLRNNDGFTLVEILVVMVIMGLVIASVYSLHINTQRTANTSEEVVDVQQNLRVALETIAADIRMAGFLVPGGTRAIEHSPVVLPIAAAISGIANADDFFHLNTVSSTRTYVRIVSPDPSDAKKVNVPGAMLRNFKDDDTVDIVSHVSGNDIKVSGLVVESILENDNQIVFKTDALNVAPRDLVVRKLSSETGTRVRYWLRSGQGGANNLQLMREDSTGDSSVIASNISDVSIVYFDRSGTAISDPENVRSIRVTITGQTDDTRTGQENYSGVKTRTLETTVALRNAF